MGRREIIYDDARSSLHWSLYFELLFESALLRRHDHSRALALRREGDARA